MYTQFPPINNPEVARLRRQSAQRKYRKRLRRMRVLWVVAGLLLVFLFIQVLVALCYSPRFWIYRIVVNNQETVTDREVIRLMNVPPRSNYYRVSLGKLARSIEKDPRVEKAGVTRGAIGVLRVNVKERQAVCQLGSSIPPLYMDAAGVLFTRPVPPNEPVPIIEGVQLPPAKGLLGKRAAFPEAGTVLSCLRELHASSEAGGLDIARVIVTPTGAGTSCTLKAVLQQGTVLFLGPPVFLREKSICIQKAILEASRKGHALDALDYIRVDFVDENTAKKGVLAAYHAKASQEESVEP